MTAGTRRSVETSPPAASERGVSLTALIGAAAVLLAILLIGWLQPLSLWRAPTNLPAPAPLVLIFGQTRDDAIRFAVPSVLAGGVWIGALVLAARGGGRRHALLALAVGALLLGALIPMNPGGTQDIYHNVADGRLLWLYHVNPTILPPIAYPDDPFFPHLWGYLELPSAYGPLWYELTGLPVRLAGDGFVANLIAQKLLVAAFMLGTTALVWLTAVSALPHRALFAVVLVGWCPLLVWESAGNGHNDSVMVFFLAAALLAAARRAYLWVLPLLALSVLVKYTTALVVPIALVWLWRRPDVSPRTIVAGALISALLAVVAFAPMYAGRDTVAALQRPGMTFILSPATLLHGTLSGRTDEDSASQIARLLTGALFCAIYVVTLVRTRGDVPELAARSFDALFAYLVLASWWFWPWYLTWLAPLAALSRGWTRPTAFATFAGAVMLTYLYWWEDPPWRSYEWFVDYVLITAGVFAPPVVIWLGGLRPRRAQLRQS